LKGRKEVAAVCTQTTRSTCRQPAVVDSFFMYLIWNKVFSRRLATTLCRARISDECSTFSDEQEVWRALKNDILHGHRCVCPRSRPCGSAARGTGVERKDRRETRNERDTDWDVDRSAGPYRPGASARRMKPWGACQRPGKRKQSVLLISDHVVRSATNVSLSLPDDGTTYDVTFIVNYNPCR